MAIRNRPFDETQHDFEKMWHFLQQDYAHRQDRFIWLCFRLGDWKYGLWRETKYIPSFFRHHAQLWLDDFDQLRGFVLSENGDEIFFIVTAQGFDYLYADVLDWTIQHWGPRYPTLKTEVHEYQVGALTQMENRGFRCMGPVAVTRAYDLRAEMPDPARLEPGFRIVDMRENPDYVSKALLYKNGFEGVDQVSNFELLRFAYSRENPAYEAAFDLSVVTPAGIHVASCVGFNDPAGSVAEVEKVCTHSQYRRQGLGEAVIQACFQRLRQRGIRRAYITGYSTEANGLYEKLGPCWHKQWFHYALDAPVTGG